MGTGGNGGTGGAGDDTHKVTQAELRANTGWKYYPTRLVAPLAMAALARQGVYRNAPGQYSDGLGAIRDRFGELVETPTAPG